jgi:site-specific DNA recombinase
MHTGGTFNLNSLRRLLTNIIYIGSVRHKGQIYLGEHPAIISAGVWDRVQKLIVQPKALSPKSRNKHLALLSGLLYCDSCAARMVPSYAMKKNRKYPYYLCLNARRKGWAACPTKSLPAAKIEASVLGRIRQARGICDAGDWDRLDRARQLEVIQGVVERIGYDGAARRVSIRLRLEETPS